MRSRTTILQAHTYQFLGTFGNPGNGEYRAELRRAVTVIQSYLQAHHHPEERVLLRLDGQYGTGAVLADLAGLPFVMRGKAYHLLKRAEIQARLFVRHQYITVEIEPSTTALPPVTSAPLSRAQRAHYRLSWAERLARNVRPRTAGRVTMRLCGVPENFATSLGLTTT